MPTRSRRALRRIARWRNTIWILAGVAWIGGILLIQKPWTGLGALQLTEWTLLGIGGVFVGSMQRRGRDYFPANLVLGLALGAPSVLYLTFAQFIFGGDLIEFSRWAQQVKVGVWGLGSSILLLAWATFLVMRVNYARAGSSLDLLGRPAPPTEDQVSEALHIIDRAVRHGVGNLIMHPAFRDLVAYVVNARETVLIRNKETGLWEPLVPKED